VLQGACHALLVVCTLLSCVVLAAHHDLDVVEADAQDQEREQVVRPCLLEAQPRSDANHFELRHKDYYDGGQCEQQAAVYAIAVSHHDETLNNQDVGCHDYIQQVAFNNARESCKENRLSKKVDFYVAEILRVYFVIQQVLE